MDDGSWRGAKGGEMTVDTPGQTILERSAVIMNDDTLEARFTVALPARGRTIMGEMAAVVLTKMLPHYVNTALIQVNLHDLSRHVRCAEDYQYLRDVELKRLNLVSFIADGSILPRSSGASQKPMSSIEAVPFVSPSSLAVQVRLPHRGVVRGMGISKGVTLITGGGFHGKSTLLSAIVDGVYPHIPGDGREVTATTDTAVKIRAEDGRYVSCLDISLFIDNLPFGKSTKQFSTEDASGSTSQASSVVEALEGGSSALLLDEDTCATNFMIRDSKMQLLVSADKEPISPFTSHVRALFATRGVSTVLVVGGSGDYFDVADRVIMMDCFTPSDVTERAHDIAARYPSQVRQKESAWDIAPRRVQRILPGYCGKICTRSRALLSLAELGELDLSCVEQLVDISQTRAIGEILKVLSQNILNSRCSTPGVAPPLVTALLEELEAQLDTQGLDCIAAGRLSGNLCRPRRQEVLAALSRLRHAVFC